MNTFLVHEPRTSALRALNYTPAIERIRRAGSTSAVPLRDLVRTFGPAYGTVFTRIDCDARYGVELLSQSDMFSAEPRGRVIRRDSMPDPDKHLIERGQVLIAGAGTLGENELYGRAILADDRLEGRYVGPDSLSLGLKDPDDDFALFAYAWLASPTGVQAIRATSYGTKILRFRSDLLTSLPVPRAPRKTVAAVAALIRESNAHRARYRVEIESARQAIQPILPEDVFAAANRPRTVIWSGALPSIRAWNFASMGTRLQILRRHWSSTLKDWLRPDGLFKGGRVARIPCRPPHGVELLSQRDVFAIRPVPRRIKAPTPPLDVQDDYLLIASRGQMSEGALFGRVERGAHTPLGAAVSEDILRLVPLEGLSAPLYSFLSSSVGFDLLRTTAYGTSIPGMREDLLLDLPVPPAIGRWVEAATKHCLAATESRVRASSSEASALRIVEEEVLPQWLA